MRFVAYITTVFFLCFSSFNYAKDLKILIGDKIPFRTDGKIDIPSHIKHVKLDIGLSISAPMSQHWLAEEDDLVVFGFEPHPGCVNAILEGKNQHLSSHLNTNFIGKRFFLIPCALGLSKNDSILFYITGDDFIPGRDCGCSSIYPPKQFEVISTTEVPIFSLEDFFEIFPFDTHPVIDYVKIDAQGADLDIVKSAGDFLKEHVVYITLEPENTLYANTTNSFQDIDNYMGSIGFVRYVQDSNTAGHTSDPTYFNPRFKNYIQDHQVIIYQHG